MNQNKLKFGFSCICGSTLSSQAEIQKHYKDCEIMKASYQELMSPWETFLKNGDDLDSMMNLYAISELIRVEIKEKINKTLQSLGQDVNMDDEEEIKENHIQPRMNQKPPSFNEDLYYEQINQVEQFEHCKYCEQQISPNDYDEQRIVSLQSTNCFHLLHIDCLQVLAYECTRASESVQCPECSGVIAEHELLNTLGKVVIEDLEKLAQVQLLSQNQNLVHCNCGNIMEVVQGMVDKNLKDEQGQPLTQDAAVHMSKFRVRCAQCQKNFCSQCQAEPYHIGKTCQQFKEYKEARKCRFCNSKIVHAPPSVKPAFKDVCRSPACIEIMNKTCDKMLPCTHPCSGFSGEKQCMPCLNEDCVNKNEALTLSQNVDSYCTICYTEGLGASPCVQLNCRHIFHVDCIMTKISNKWNGPRITFSYMECPSCKKQIEAPHCEPIQQLIVEAKKIYDIVLEKSLDRAKAEGIDKDARLKNPADPYFNNLNQYVLDRLAFYECFKCKMAYFGGLKECGNQLEQNPQAFKPEELICGPCSGKNIGGGISSCQRHGKDYIEYKCRFCCSVALWFCFNTTHFCEPCHQKAGNNQNAECKGQECPLKIDHPPNGTEYGLGCGLCRNMGLDQVQGDDGIQQPLAGDNIRRAYARPMRMPRPPQKVMRPRNEFEVDYQEEQAQLFGRPLKQVPLPKARNPGKADANKKGPKKYQKKF